MKQISSSVELLPVTGSLHLAYATTQPILSYATAVMRWFAWKRP